MMSNISGKLIEEAINHEKVTTIRKFEMNM